MRRVSNDVAEQSVSGFFSKYQSAIFDALVDDGAPTPDALMPLYVSSRRYSAAPGEIEDLLERLPSDFRLYYRDQRAEASIPDNEKNLSLGYYELDLLDFIFNVRKNRVLRIVGSVGVGKTTFLNYIFKCVRPNCPPLQRYVPVFVSFMAYPTSNLREDDLADMIYTAIEASLRANFSDDTSLAEIRDFQKKLFEYGIERARRDGLYSLLKLLSEALRDTRDFEFVFIFDNVDHLSGQSVSVISHAARALFQNTRLCTIIAMRPPAFATNVETDAHRGAFYTFRIALPPPSLNSLFQKRLERVVGNDSIEYVVDGTQYTLQISNAAEAVKNAVANILDEPNEKLLMVGVSNNNIRLAGAAFAKFLRWPGMRPDFLLSPRIGVDRHFPGGFGEHLLKGVMLGSQDLYRDDARDRPAVTNVLAFRSPGYKPDYLIQHRILSLLKWADTTISIERLLDWLKPLGYEYTHTMQCVGHLLRRALVFSPETEHDVDEIRHITISESGRYYIENFFSSSEYLLEAILDVDLLHREISAAGHPSFLGRLDSIFEYLSYVEAIEKVQMQSLINNRDKIPHILGAFYRSGLLQRSIISALRPLVRRMDRSANPDVRASADSFEEALDASRHRTEDAERNLTQIVFGANILVPDEVGGREMLRRRWRDSQITIDIPKFLTTGEPNKVMITCNLPAGERAQFLYGRLERADLGIDEFTTLNRDGITHNFSGSLTIPWSGEPTEVNELRVSIFADTKPILSTAIQAVRLGD